MSFEGQSKKSASGDGGEVWNPTSRKVTGQDGKNYNLRNENPKPGEEPKFWGYYIGMKVIPPKEGSGRDNDSIIHHFEDANGKKWDVWGQTDLTNQLKAVAKDDGYGVMCQLQWNGYLVKGSSKNKPKEVLDQKLPADFYHDWEVIVGSKEKYPPIKVEGAEVYKPQSANVAPPSQPTAPAPAMPAQLPNATIPVSTAAPVVPPQPTTQVPSQPVATTPAPMPVAPAPNAPPVSGDFESELMPQSPPPDPDAIPFPY